MLICQYIYIWLVTNLWEGGGGSFNYLMMSFNLNQYRGVVETFNTQKWIFQQSRKKCSLINYVNINSVLDYPLSIFILLVFLFLGLKHISHKTSIKLFVLFLFVISFRQTLFLAAKPVGIIKWWSRSKFGPYTYCSGKVINMPF